MSSFVIMPLLFCAMTLFFDTLCYSTLEAEPGENVSIWIEDNFPDTCFIYWFKHTSTSVPLLLGCKQAVISGRTQKCYFFNESERIVMSVHGKNTSLTITAVNLSDTGLYYCSFMHLAKMNFCKSVYLQVKGRNETHLIKNLDKTEDYGSFSVFSMLTIVFGAVIVILLILLIIIIPKHLRGTNTKAQVHEDQESEMVNYAAVQVSNKKTNRSGKLKNKKLSDHQILYSSVRP